MAYVFCSVCGKRLMERLPNGLWKFKFGRMDNDSIVHMEIHGSLKIKCLRKSCRHINILNFFPGSANVKSVNPNEGRFWVNDNKP